MITCAGRRTGCSLRARAGLDGWAAHLPDHGLLGRQIEPGGHLPDHLFWAWRLAWQTDIFTIYK